MSLHAQTRRDRPAAEPGPRVMPRHHPLERAADRVALGGRAAMPPLETTPGATHAAAGPTAPRVVAQALATAGQPLDAALRARLEPRIGRDLSNVRIHHDGLAARSAAALQAQAFTSGRHIVFGAARWNPGSAAGRQLLAHELAHHASDPDGGGRRIWRKPLDTADFDAGHFSDAVLLAYLKTLRDSGRIVDERDSDDKARGVVRRWRAGGDDFALEPALKVLLVREMQSGFTGDDDERAILQLLQHSARPDLERMFGPGALDPEDLDDDFHGAEEDALRALYDQLFVGGRAAALRHRTSFAPEPEPAVAGAFSPAGWRAMIAERMARIDRVLRDRPPGQRDPLADRLLRRDAQQVRLQLAALAPAQRDAAVAAMASDRVQRDSQARALDDTIAKAADPQRAERLARRQIVLRAEVLLLDLAMQAGFRDIARAAPATAAGFQALTVPLDAATRQAAQQAITPMTAGEVQAEATGTAPPPAPVFHPAPLPGESDRYQDKIKARIPNLIAETHAALAAQRTRKEHDDPKLTRSMDDMQAIANQAKAEVDRVFGHLYDAARFSAFQGDRRNRAGRLVRRGNLRDVWQVEEDRRRASAGYAAQSARFWLYYLIQNDDAVKAINFAHDASPAFDESTRPQNDEARLIRQVADPFLASHRMRLFEIGRAWDAFKQGADIYIQLFKDPDAQKDRVFLWDMYFTLMHEYLHKLSHRRYSAYADRLGGEHSTEGNTLIEGVDSLLTEVTWSSAFGRASLPAVRQIVEPDAVAAHLPFDPDLLPAMPHRRYDTYEHALRLVAVVGIRNLYAAYFQGRVDLIGGP